MEAGVCLTDDFICVAALKQDLARRHKDALQTCKSHNLALVKSNQQAELEVRHQVPLPILFLYLFVFVFKICLLFTGSGSPCERRTKNDG